MMRGYGDRFRPFNEVTDLFNIRILTIFQYPGQQYIIVEELRIVKNHPKINRLKSKVIFKVTENPHYSIRDISEFTVHEILK